MHLYGYPHVPRASTGVFDPLMASALYLQEGEGQALFVATDIVFIPKALGARARSRIAEKTGVRPATILISATHTHSGPGTVTYASNESDGTVPPIDTAYLVQLEDGIVEAACAAVERKEPAEIGFAVADGACVGTNRRDPSGPSNPRVPVLAVRRLVDKTYMAAMLVCSMHPTVLHEDSTLISGDFPAFTRLYLQKNVLGPHGVVLHHSGASGNQSPRHVIRGTTFDEADRIGSALGASIAQSLDAMTFATNASIVSIQRDVNLPLREFPTEDEAAAKLEHARKTYERLVQAEGASPAVRTAECDVFGAEETLTLARASEAGRLTHYASTCMPAEVQLIGIGPWVYVAFPGELFVEFALEIEAEFPNAVVVTLANGELQGYLVTGEAVREGGYEASNALFKSPDSGNMLVQAAKEALKTHFAPQQSTG